MMEGLEWTCKIIDTLIHENKKEYFYGSSWLKPRVLFISTPFPPFYHAHTVILSQSLSLFMATSSPLPLPELHFLSPQTTPKRRISFSKLPSSPYSVSRHVTSNVSLRTSRIRATREESALAERLNDVEWTGNGAAAAAADGNGASVGGYVNGATNGSLVKYGYENGNGVSAEVLEVEASNKLSEDGRKKRLEEIGKEDAWFKQSGNEQVEVRRFDCFDCVSVTGMKYERVAFRRWRLRLGVVGTGSRLTPQYKEPLRFGDLLPRSSLRLG